MALNVEFADTQYRFSHGQAPRGFGGWAFEFPHSSAVTAAALERMRAAIPAEFRPRVEIVAGLRPVVQVWVNGTTLGIAKRHAAAAVRAAFDSGFVVLQVAP